MQTLQPSAKIKGLVGSHGQIIHSTKDGLKPKHVNPKIPASLGSSKIHVFEDESSSKHPAKLKSTQVEERGVQTDMPVNEELKSITSGN